MKSTRRNALLAAAALPAAAAQTKRAKQAHFRGEKPKETPLYSEAISYGDLVFISGHGVAAGDIRAQTKTVLDQIEAALKVAGSSLEKVLKANVYLASLEDYAAMNEAYRGRFGATPPVRTTVAVSGIPLPGCLVEIDVIAHR
jgi:2-iminobutanoate/2-iminopropanoate deaminase